MSTPSDVYWRPVAVDSPTEELNSVCVEQSQSISSRKKDTFRDHRAGSGWTGATRQDATRRSRRFFGLRHDVSILGTRSAAAHSNDFGFLCCRATLAASIKVASESSELLSSVNTVGR